MRISGLMVAASAAALLGLAGCSSNGGASATDNGDSASKQMAVVTVQTDNGPHKFNVEIASTPAQQEKGLMFRTDIPQDGGMLFTPYPASGGGPREASFWMKNTPSPLDIIFIRPDHSIARIADNTVPFSESPVSSGEPVMAVLELRGGRAVDVGMSEGDKVSWNAGAGAND